MVEAFGSQLSTAIGLCSLSSDAILIGASDPWGPGGPWGSVEPSMAQILGYFELSHLFWNPWSFLFLLFFPVQVIYTDRSLIISWVCLLVICESGFYWRWSESCCERTFANPSSELHLLLRRIRIPSYEIPGSIWLSRIMCSCWLIIVPKFIFQKKDSPTVICFTARIGDPSPPLSQETLHVSLWSISWCCLLEQRSLLAEIRPYWRCWVFYKPWTAWMGYGCGEKQVLDHVEENHR